jgi:hypothetical protein
LTAPFLSDIIISSTETEEQKMAKATKKQAREAYDYFFGTLGNWYLNGRTVEENKRQAPALACYEKLKVHANTAAVIVANPNKRLSEDSWLMESLSVTIPARLESFRIRYGL